MIEFEILQWLLFRIWYSTDNLINNPRGSVIFCSGGELHMYSKVQEIKVRNNVSNKII